MAIDQCTDHPFYGFIEKSIKGQEESITALFDIVREGGPLRRSISHRRPDLALFEILIRFKL